MNDDPTPISIGKPADMPHAKGPAADRGDPRGQALRDNLARRKAQARGRAEANPAKPAMARDSSA